MLRLIGPDDFNLLSKFFEKNNSSLITNGFTAFPLNDESAKFICKPNHKDKYYFYTEELSILGFSMLRGWEEGFDIPSFGVFVDKDWQGKGIGNKITRETIEECLKLGCDKVRLSVYLSNKPAYSLYKKFGFYEVEKFSIIQNGRSEIKIIMMKDLK